MSVLNKLTFWYFSKRSLPYWGICLLDSIIFIISALSVYTLNNGVVYTAQHFWTLLISILIFLIFYILGFKIFRTYSGIIRYSSFVDLQRIALAIVFGFACSMVARLALDMNSLFVPIRARDIIAWSLIAMLLMWSVRVTVKYIYDTTYKSINAERAYIYGVKQGGISIAKSLRNQDPSTYTVSGFVSDNPSMKNHVLLGVNVYQNDDTLIERMKSNNIKALFVSPLKSESFRKNENLVNELIDAGIKIFMVPGEQEWDGKSDLSHTQLHEIDIEDLLPREKIDVDMETIGKQITDKKILITGAAGSIGSEIVRQVANYAPTELILIDQAETPLHDIRLMMSKNFAHIKSWTIVADIANTERMREIFSQHRPDYVFHAAAYKHVPMMEDNPGESVRNNIEGTRVIADLAVEFGASKFVMISTDKAVNPTNVMGCSKRICEIYVQSLDKAEKEGKINGHTQFVTTRFGNVLGSNGSVIPLFKQQIKEGGPITVTHPNIIRFFMLIPEACKLVLEAGTQGNGGEIFVFDMGEPVKIVDLAKRMIKLSGAKIDIKFTGLREGEKLYEEVLNDKEITLPTFHPKIKIAKVREYDFDDIKREIDVLIKNVYTDDNMTVVARMKALVPEFKSKNSVYEILDKED